MLSPRSPHHQLFLAALLLIAVALLSLAPVLAQPRPSQLGFGYARVALPMLRNQVVTTPPANPQPQIAVWLDIPGQVRISDRLQIIVNAENQGKSDFAGRTEVIIPYEGHKFRAVDSSFDHGKGDWIKQNKFPTDLTVEFGALRRGELRRGVIYFDLQGNGLTSQVGDKLRIRARNNNNSVSCGQIYCPTNQRYVEVTDQFVSGGIGTLAPGSRQVQKLGDMRYGEQRRWVPEGFRPDEQVVTWLNTTGSGQRPLTLQQRADAEGKVYFSIDISGLPNGFYSIVAHGQDTRTEIVGEFQVVNSPIVNAAARGLTLIPLPSPAEPPAVEPGMVQLDAAPVLNAGQTTLTGVVAVAGTGGATRLEGVQVNVIDADGNVVGAAASDHYGGYIIAGLSAGSYTVGFDPRLSFDATARQYQPLAHAAVSVPAGGSLQLDAELAPGSSVSGTVTGAGAGGLEGVSVLLLSGTTVVEATTTGADGSYVLTGVPSGSYTLQFDPATGDEAVRAFSGMTSGTINVTAPTALGGQNVALPRNSATVEISGTIVAGDSSQPLAEVLVLFERYNPTASRYEYAGLALSDATGAYSGVLPTGRYRVAFLPGYSPNSDSARYLGEYFNDVANGPAGATEIDLSGGQSATANAVLTPGATIAGTVSGGGAPLNDAAVLIYDVASSTLADLVFTGEDGAYRSAGLPAGSYRVEFATYLSDDATTQTYAGATRAQPIALGAGAGATGINASLSKGGAINGTVTGTGGASLADVLVLVINTQGTAAESDDTLAGLALTGTDGAYAARGLAAGSYVLAFITELTGGPDVLAYFDEYYNDAADIANATPLSVTAGATTANISAGLTLGGQIRGRVTDGVNGFGIAGVLVEVYAPADPNTLVAFAITDEGGDYATTALTTGASYILHFNPSFAGGQSTYTAEYYNDAATSGAAQQISIPSTTPITGIDATLAPAP